MSVEREKDELRIPYMCLRHTPSITERPSCWSRAAWGAGVETEAGGASSRPAPHTALASIAGAPRGPCSRARWTDVSAGAPEAAAEEEEKRGE